MSLYKEIYDAITADATVVAVVSTRVYPGYIPESVEERPAIVFGVDGLAGDLDTRNTLAGPIKLLPYSVTVALVGRNTEETHNLIEDVENALSGYTGGRIEGVFQEGRVDDWDIPGGEMTAAMSFTIYYRRV